MPAQGRGRARHSGTCRPRGVLDKQGSKARKPKTCDLESTVASTTTPAYAVDSGGRIVAWNRAAERLLGVSSSEATDRPCNEVLRGKDIFGNRFCGESCPVRRMARRREPLCGFDLFVQTACSRWLEVRMQVVVVPGASSRDFALLHLFEPTPLCRRVAETTVPYPENSELGAAPERSKLLRLTGREVEILRLLAAGESTRDISDGLFICDKTVRNHVQNIFRKLGVHSRLQAVSLAHRTALL